MAGAVVNLDEVKTSLSKLVDRAVAGEDVIIAKADRSRRRLNGALSIGLE